tara:strand:- start:106079 stop:106771 length:693 start_codon:yes stop_codon:yes gene_type:complete
MKFLERAFIFLTVKIIWKYRPIFHKALRRFQAVEADGVWHLQRSLDQVEDKKTRFKLFLHLLEEESHADSFAKMYEKMADEKFVKLLFERRPIGSPVDPLWKSIAFVHIGEEHATDRFQYISKFHNDPYFKKNIDSIVEDEMGHVDLTDNLLLEVGASREDIDNEYKSIAQNRWKESFFRLLSFIYEKFANTILSILYYIFAPFLFLQSRKKLKQYNVSLDSNKIKRFES